MRAWALETRLTYNVRYLVKYRKKNTLSSLGRRVLNLHPVVRLFCFDLFFFLYIYVSPLDSSGLSMFCTGKVLTTNLCYDTLAFCCGPFRHVPHSGPSHFPFHALMHVVKRPSDSARSAPSPLPLRLTLYCTFVLSHAPFRIPACILPLGRFMPSETYASPAFSPYIAPYLSFRSMTYHSGSPRVPSRSVPSIYVPSLSVPSRSIIPFSSRGEGGPRPRGTTGTCTGPTRTASSSSSTRRRGSGWETISELSPP